MLVTGHNDYFIERHEEAKGGKPRAILHDRYSLISIVTSNVYLNPQQVHCLKEGVKTERHLSDLLEL